MPSRHSLRTIIAALLAVLALVVFVPPLIKLSSFRKSIVESISGALGRPVSVREISLRLFPQPGFTFEGFVVQDDPAFSAEPLLRAEQVTASLRWSSLWRWRPEIGTLTLESPTGMQPWSLNVVRRQDGRWNLQSLLLRASQTSAAPTGKTRPEARLRFPYLEGEGGRINFKSGMEKKAYALSEADFALWLASENEWSLRLSARPMRTDANLTDTGIVQINGAIGRAAALDETPLRLRVSLRGSQLGQLSRLVYGRDRGWRGSVAVQAELAGTPRDLKLTGSGSIDDFRRYDIITPDNLRLATTCTAEYHGPAQELSHIDCRARNDELAMRGRIANLAGPPQYELAMVVKQAPMAELTRLARHAKFALPPDLTAAGILDAEFAYRNASAQPGWTGEGTTSDFVLRSGVLGKELELGSISFELAQERAKAEARGKHRRNARNVGPADAGNQGVRLTLAPFALPLGGPGPATVRASISAKGYEVAVEGDAELQRVFHVARGLGLRAPAFGVSGNTRLDLQIAGAWSGFTPPVSTGSMQLHNVTALLPGVNAPAHVHAANAVLLPDQVRVENLSAAFSSSGRNPIEGSLLLARDCDPAQPCAVQFDLHTGEISLAELNRLLNPQMQRLPWYRLLGGNPAAGPAKFEARGRIRVDRAGLGSLELQHLLAQAEFRGRKLQLHQVQANLLGGKLHAEWSADFSADVPHYSGGGTVEHIDLLHVAALTHDAWATGTGSGSFKLEMAGRSAAELAQSAEGDLNFDWQNGALPHLVLAGAGNTPRAAPAPLRLKRFSGHAVLRDRQLEFQQSKIEAADGIYRVSGDASLGRLELKLTRNSHGYMVSGTVEKPTVAPLSEAETQAALGK